MYYRLDLIVVCPLCGKELPFDDDYGVYPCDNCNIELNEDYEIIEDDN